MHFRVDVVAVVAAAAAAAAVTVKMVEIVSGLIQSPFSVDEDALVLLHASPFLVQIKPVQRHAPAQYPIKLFKLNQIKLFPPFFT